MTSPVRRRGAITPTQGAASVAPTVRRMLVVGTCLGGAALAAACAHTATPPAPAPTPIASPPARDTVTLQPTRTQKIAQLREGIDSLLNDPGFHNAFWGVLIVDPATSDTLYARNAHRLFMPASNMKVITSSVAIAQLGLDYQYRTAFATRGRVRDGTLFGDLLVIGRGDPTMSDHMMHDAMTPLRAVADSLAAHGIHRITGHIVSSGDAFPDANVGFGWGWDELMYSYAAGVDELMFNEGFANLSVHGGRRPGSLARITTTPIPDYPAVRSRVVTVAPGDSSLSKRLTTALDPTTGAVVVAGTVATGDSIVLEVAYQDQDAAYLRALAAALHERGIRLRTSPVTVPDDNGPMALRPMVLATNASHVSPADDTLFVLTSPALRDILPILLKPSQNQIAEILLKTLGLERTGIGSADSGRRVVESQLAAWGIPSDEFVIRDGSGLSRHDYLAPATLVRVFTLMQQDSAFQTFYDALPIAGVDGTISDRMRGTPAAGNVHAKTGTVDRARSLSGYVTTADGIRLIFSFLCNNWTVPVHQVEQAQDAILERIASMSLGHS